MFGFTFSPTILATVVSDDASQRLMVMSNGALAIEENDGEWHGRSIYICLDRATLRKLREALNKPDVVMTIE